MTTIHELELNSVMCPECLGQCSEAEVCCLGCCDKCRCLLDEMEREVELMAIVERGINPFAGYEGAIDPLFLAQHDIYEGDA